jgi:predicted trehalose synthase
LAAIPKSIIQTSPGLMPRIFVFPPVKHQRAVERDLVAHVAVLIGDFQQAFANSPAFSFAKLRQFLDDFRCAHSEIITSVRKFVRREPIPNFFR